MPTIKAFKGIHPSPSLVAQVVIPVENLLLADAKNIRDTNPYSFVNMLVPKVENRFLMGSKSELAFKKINYLNQNKSISFDLNHKNNLKFLLKDKYNYLVSFDCYKYKYLILLKSKPIAYNYTQIDIDIRQDRQKNFNNKSINFSHYKRINNIIYKYIYSNIILKNKESDLSIELFKFFNNY